MEKRAHNNKFFIILIVLVVVIGTALWMMSFYNNEVEQNNDGGNTNTSPIAGWQTYTGDEATFQYPETVGTSYISETDWPPQIQVIDESFSCTEAGDQYARGGRTERRVIGGQEYCVTAAAEGAAGSMYIQYAYAFPRNDGTAILTFSLRFVQCANYDGAEQQSCERERDAFGIDSIVHQIQETVVIQ